MHYVKYWIDDYEVRHNKIKLEDRAGGESETFEGFSFKFPFEVAAPPPKRFRFDVVFHSMFPARPLAKLISPLTDLHKQEQEPWIFLPLVADGGSWSPSSDDTLETLVEETSPRAEP